MAQPTPYEREFNFSNQQAATPSDPIPAPHLDAELNRVKLTLDQTLANLALIQQDDGTIDGAALGAGTVGYDQLDPSIVGDLIAAGATPEAFAAALSSGLDAALETTTGVDNFLGMKSGVPVKAGVPFIQPENYGSVHTPDDTTAILLARDAALTSGAPLVFASGVYTLSEKMDIPSDMHVIVMPGARLRAKATGFADDVLIDVGAVGDAEPSQFWSISGGGYLDCQNVIDTAINVTWGRFARILDLNILGASKHAVMVGESGAAYASYEVDICNVRADHNDVANTASSIAFYMKNATDCHLDLCYSIGYRTGIRTEGGSIDISRAHVWNRPVHGPLTHCFDIQGDNNSLVQSYADNPTNYGDGAITDAYGVYLYGRRCVVDGIRIYMNLLATPDVSTDNIVTGLYEARNTFSDIGLISFEGASASKRYKAPVSLFSGSSSKLRAPRFINTAYFASTVNLYGSTTTIDGAATDNRDLDWRTLGNGRWTMRLSGSESGSGNNGGNTIWISRNDDGSFLRNHAEYTRADGATKFGGKMTWVPPASATPSSNGDLTFEATSNTTLTVKYKGSDGTVRSGMVTLI